MQKENKEKCSKKYKVRRRKKERFKKSEISRNEEMKETV